MLKSPDAFRTISEVAEDLDLPQHVLRFWETRFLQVRPLKRAGGRRYYRPADVLLLRSIRQLLYEDGYTIKGVQRLLREQGAKALRAGDQPALAETMMAAEVGDIDGGGGLSADLRDGEDGDAAATAEHHVLAEGQTIWGDLRPIDGEGSTPVAVALPRERPVAWPTNDRAALHDALSLVEECAEILRAARQQRF